MYPEWTKLREAEEEYEASRGLTNIARITLRHNGEAIGFVDVFPGEGNFGVIVNEDSEEEFKEACLKASMALADIAHGDD
jgi:hypothetical protein